MLSNLNKRTLSFTNYCKIHETKFPDALDTGVSFKHNNTFLISTLHAYDDSRIENKYKCYN